MINCLHHFEILTNSSQKLLKYFIDGFNFKLVTSKCSASYEQYLIKSNSINFLITSIESPNLNNKHNHYCAVNKPSLDIIQSKNILLYDCIRSKQNTVFNAAFQVTCIDKILKNCANHNVRVLRDKELLYDKNFGYVQLAMIESCVDGVVHSLIDLNDYKGQFLPGFETSNNFKQPHLESNLTHFDHLTYAVERNKSKGVIDWYEKIFNMKRFMLYKEENEGLMVKTGESGMNLKCINYWMCAETGVEFDAKSSNDFKFVISEPLENSISKETRNQISIFLDENNGPGIQHIGLNSNNIIKTVTNSKSKKLDIQYYSTPDEYYQQQEKMNEIERCGLDLKQMKDNHILLDADLSVESAELNINKAQPLSTYLLQVFTQPIFDKNTVFLELIQRVGNAQGFGTANIKALWNAVQRSIHNVKIKLKKNN